MGISAPRPRSTGWPGAAGDRCEDHKVLLLSGFQPPPDRPFRRLGGVLRCLPAVRLQAPALGRAARLEMAGAGGTPRAVPELFKPGERLGQISAGPAGTPAFRKGLPLIAAGPTRPAEVLGAGALEPTIACLSWHHGDHQHHSRPLPGNRAADSTLSGGDSRSFQYRGDDLSRLLDGQLVQARVRLARDAAGARAGGRAGATVRRTGQRRAARLDGPDPATLLVAGNPRTGLEAKGR